MIEAVLTEVPVGTPIDQAQRFMEHEGFQCALRTNEAFLDRDGLDYVYCNRSEGGIVQRRWKVAIVQRDGRVVEVLASTGLLNPALRTGPSWEGEAPSEPRRRRPD